MGRLRQNRKGYKDQNGYNCHGYECDDGAFHTILEHIAKWEYFYGRIPDGLEIDHITPIKDGGTNKLSNLRIGTHKDNMNNKETLKVLKESHKNPQRNAKISSALKGRKKSEEHRINVANAHKKKVYQYTKDLVLVAIWDCAEDAAKHGFCERNISRCCRGERKSHKGYIWSYEPL